MIDSSNALEIVQPKTTNDANVITVLATGKLIMLTKAHPTYLYSINVLLDVSSAFILTTFRG